MDAPHCRIRSVRDRQTGHQIRVLRNGRPEHVIQLVRDAAKIADVFPDGMAAFLVLGIGENGYYSFGYRIDGASFVGPTLMAALVAEIVRREFATEVQIKDFAVRHGWLSEKK